MLCLFPSLANKVPSSQSGVDDLGVTKEESKCFFNGPEDVEARQWEFALNALLVPKASLENDAYNTLPWGYLRQKTT